MPRDKDTATAKMPKIPEGTTDRQVVLDCVDSFFLTEDERVAKFQDQLFDKLADADWSSPALAQKEIDDPARCVVLSVPPQRTRTLFEPGQIDQEIVADDDGSFSGGSGGGGGRAGGGRRGGLLLHVAMGFEEGAASKKWDRVH